MISICKIDNNKFTNEGEVITAELVGLSTDVKPKEVDNKVIGNGSKLIEMDTGKLFFFDVENEEWKEF